VAFFSLIQIEHGSDTYPARFYVGKRSLQT